MEQTVFISHNSANKKEAREIGLFLTAEDINVWFDEWKIPFGSSIPGHVNNGLDDCTHFILLWSKEALESKWVERELQSILHKSLSREAKNIVIIPVCLDDTPLPIIVADKLAVRYSKGDEVDRYAIVKAVTGEAPSRNFIEATVKKYNELIFSSDDNIFGISACPHCGNTELVNSSPIDYIHDNQYFIISCKHCGWSDWSE